MVYGVCQYIWPDRILLQARLLACFALLAAGRVVNLAVPILFKRVVDRLSYVSGRTHPLVTSFTTISRTCSNVSPCFSDF